jgi:hypothetical protein
MAIADFCLSSTRRDLGDGAPPNLIIPILAFACRTFAQASDNCLVLFIESACLCEDNLDNGGSSTSLSDIILDFHIDASERAARSAGLNNADSNDN